MQCLTATIYNGYQAKLYNYHFAVAMCKLKPQQKKEEICN